MLNLNNNNLTPGEIPSTDEIFRLLLAALAAEELSLADLISAEADKVRSVLGILPGQTVRNPSIDELERIDRAVERILRGIIKKEIILSFQLEDILDFLSTSSSTTSTTTTTTASTTTTTASTTTTTASTTTTTASTTTTTASTTTTTASTTTTTASTTTTTASTTTTTASTTTTTASTTTTTASTTTTTQSTTSTTQTTTTTTRRPCTGLCGVTGSATISQGNSVFTLVANVCSSCSNFVDNSIITYSEVAQQTQLSIAITPNPATLDITCGPDRIIISGDALIVDTEGSGLGTFDLEIRNNQPNGNDAFQISARRETPFRQYVSPTLNVPINSFSLFQCPGV
jgi:hypothetical protein